MAAEKLEERCKHPVVEKIIEMRGVMCDYTVYHCLPFFGGCNRIYRDLMDDWHEAEPPLPGVHIDESDCIASFQREQIVVRDSGNKERNLYVSRDINPLDNWDKDRVMRLMK